MKRLRIYVSGYECLCPGNTLNGFPGRLSSAVRTGSTGVVQAFRRHLITSESSILAPIEDRTLLKRTADRRNHSGIGLKPTTPSLTVLAGPALKSQNPDAETQCRLHLNRRAGLAPMYSRPATVIVCHRFDTCQSTCCAACLNLSSA